MSTTGEHNFKAFAGKYPIEELANVAGCHVQTMRKYKAGNPMPSDIIIQIANHYSTSTDRVLGHHVPIDVVNEDFPTRPPAIHTVTQTNLDYEKQCREVKFNNELLKKRVEELRQERDSFSADNNRLHQENKTLHERLNRLISAAEETPIAAKTTTISVEKAEIIRLRAILQSIHFLSEEK